MHNIDWEFIVFLLAMMVVAVALIVSTTVITGDVTDNCFFVQDVQFCEVE